MQDYQEYMVLLERVIHLYNGIESKKRDFGLGYELSMKEIHTIQYIGDQPSINVTALASKQGVTKGAASQMISRLVKKGLVIKEKAANSDLEIVLSLTAEGKKAYLGHQAFHQLVEDKILALTDKYSDEDFALFRKVLLDLEAAILDFAEDVTVAPVGKEVENENNS